MVVSVGWCIFYIYVCVFFFKQKTAYEIRISDWSSDVCSSDLGYPGSGCCDCICQREYGKRRIKHAAKFRRGHGRAFSAEYPAGGSKYDRKQIGRASCRERVCQYV